MLLVFLALLLALVAPAGGAEPLSEAGLRLPARLDLQQAIAFAIEHHPTLRVANQEQRAAAARVQQSEGAFLPKLAAGAYVNTGNTGMIVPGAPGVEPQFWSSLPGGAVNFNLALMMPLYTGGRLQARLAQARAEERAQIARTALALREVVRDVRRSYYEVLQAQASLDTARMVVQQQQELLRLTRERVEVGSEALYVQRRMEAEVARAQQSLNRAQAEERSSSLSFNVALGSGVTAPVEVAVPARSSAPTLSPEQEVERSLASRPDLIVARAMLESADENLKQVLATYSPQLSLYAMAEQMRQPVFSNRPFEGGYQVGVVLSWPLFDAEREGRSEEADAMREARRAEIQRLEQQVSAQVLQSRARLEAASANEELAETELQAAEVELRIARRRFELGRGLYLEVLDAVATLSRARQSRVNAQRERGQAEAEYLYASGRFE